MVGTDIYTGTPRFTFGITELLDGIEIVALALGMFGIAEFLKNVNRLNTINTSNIKVRFRDMRPSREDLRRSVFPWFRGTIIGSLCSLIPGTGPTIASFVSYAAEKKLSKTPEKFGTGMIEGVACPEASTHSSVQGDFIPTMSLGIPGDAVMALLLGALIIQGIQPGPQLIVQHPDIFWGLIASFWIGNIILVVLNVPMIGIWVKLLSVPYKHLYPAALFFICIGVYSANNSFFAVAETLVIGIIGYAPSPGRSRSAIVGQVLIKQSRPIRRARDQVNHLETVADCLLAGLSSVGQPFWMALSQIPDATGRGCIHYTPPRSSLVLREMELFAI